VQGYHVQITARSDGDLSPEGILQKVSDASGAKYSSESATVPVNAATKPPIATKPVFTPSRSGGIGPSTLSTGHRTVTPRNANVDDDGWGADAPPVTRTQLEKVPSAYKPTKVNMQQLTSQNPVESRFKTTQSEDTSDVVKGAYQPIGKVDIAAIRRQAREAGEKADDRPETVKGSYEPVGKVDIGAIRARAQQPADIPPARTEDPQQAAPSNPVSARASAFQPSERLTSLPKPKVANRFTGASTFTGTKAPLPGEFGAKPTSPAAPVGITSRTFADEGGKTPAQLWAERKAKERGTGGITDAPIPQPLAQSQSGEGEWKSSYTGKNWNPVQTAHTGMSSGSNTAQQAASHDETSQEPESDPPSDSVGSVRDRFAGAQESTSAPPPLDTHSKPNAGRGIPLPGLPTAPAASEAQYEEETQPDIPPPPPQPRSPTPPTPERESSPIRVAMPVSRNAPEELVQDAHEELESPPQPLPIRSLEAVIPKEEELEEPTHDTARATAEAAAETTAQDETTGESIRAIVQYDYEKAEANEIELKEGEYVTDIEMVDQDWWLGVNAGGERGLFPSNYVEIVEDRSSHNPGHEQHERQTASGPAEEPDSAEPAGEQLSGEQHTATALYDYEAAEDNEISFPDGAKILNIVSF
jgi:hypothetical protein